MASPEVGLPLFEGVKPEPKLNQEDRIFIWMMHRGLRGLTTAEMMCGICELEGQPIYCANYTGRTSDGFKRGHTYLVESIENSAQKKYTYTGFLGNIDELKPQVRRAVDAWGHRCWKGDA